MGDETHVRTQPTNIMNMKIIFAIALVFAGVACAHDADFSETTNPENEQLESVAVAESAGTQAQWGRRRRRRWIHVARERVKKSFEKLHKKVSEGKKKVQKRKEKKSKEVQAKKAEKHKKHVAERKAKERSYKEKGHKKRMELIKKHKKEQAGKEKAHKNKKVKVCWLHTYYKKAKCTAHPLSWYTNCPKGRRAGWTRCGFMKLGGRYNCRHRQRRCKMTAYKNTKGFKKFKHTKYRRL